MKRIKRRHFVLVGFLIINSVVIGQISSSLEKTPCVPCAEIKNINLPDVVILQASQLDEPATHCKITGVIGKEINFELLLPNSWNSRYVMGGNKGFAGSFQYDKKNLTKGYATGGTDTGHLGSDIKADWALNSIERKLNFGYLAVHLTAVTSKEIIRQFYCSAPEYSYFVGCSRGGGQALMEAQRYPNDFDGIVAGAPAYNFSNLGAEYIQNAKAIYPNPENRDNPIITLENLELLQARILEHCDALDGIKDQILNDPTACDFDFQLLPKCTGEIAGKDCFTTSQLEAIMTVYSGVKSQKESIYPGFPFGAENHSSGWRPWIVGPNPGTMKQNSPSLQFAFGTELYKYLVFNDPDWDYSTYDFSNFSNDTSKASEYLNATSTDYSLFKERGGKMIIYHGWSDPALSALSTIEHYEEAKSKDQQIEQYIRLFMLPGVLHCGRGPGPSDTDWLELVRSWVENGDAPEKVILSKTEKGKTTINRPVFPYPKKAIYNGKGDPYSSNSFKVLTPKEQN